ncbi:Meckel syndrome type 1 protein homolog [Lucilia sericata]|uniref:Meckel syndrome type 1 protein homolog n=1 Tax=Lucilia sericata TaxID=13632 RepID=UPI0018A866F8|nr:Meckel syndrome type 1 protein homolog [Lucilia sericata]
MINSLPKHSGSYFVKDNINNLQFKIHFRAINNLLKLPKYNVPTESNNESFVSKRTIENSPADDDKIVLLKWQQKVFSANECQLYSDLKNCTNDQQKKYHDEIIKEKDRDKKHTKKKRQRKQAKTEVEETTAKGNFIFTYVHEDHFFPNNEQVHKFSGQMKEVEGEPFEQMFVYAALKPDTQLAVLRWFKQDRLLYIYPDFTATQDQPYFIEINSDYRHLYSYGIEDISPKAIAPPSEQEQFLYLPELPAHWRIEDELVTKFVMPPKRTQRCAILFTINDVSGFEYDNVHVHYRIKLPENTILEEGLLDATTHTASNWGSNTTQHIGLTWQITLLCEEQFDPSQYLRIFFEVISIDSWERERVEGFSHYNLNLLQPCNSTVKLTCIRPVESLLESINRYFIGGRRKFDYEQFVCEFSEDEVAGGMSNFHCRYGGHMQNSGQLSFTCQMLTQRNCELLNPCLSRSSGMTLDDIMMAYKEARRRLEAVALK